MKAMVLREFNQPLKLEEVETPRIGAGELLVHVKSCGVCASNLKYAKGSAPYIKLPHILGHEPREKLWRLDRMWKGLLKETRYVFIFLSPVENVFTVLLDKKIVVSMLSGSVWSSRVLTENM